MEWDSMLRTFFEIPIKKRLQNLNRVLVLLQLIVSVGTYTFVVEECIRLMNRSQILLVGVSFIMYITAAPSLSLSPDGKNKKSLRRTTTLIITPHSTTQQNHQNNKTTRPFYSPFFAGFTFFHSAPDRSWHAVAKIDKKNLFEKRVKQQSEFTTTTLQQQQQ